MKAAAKQYRERRKGGVRVNGRQEQWFPQLGFHKYKLQAKAYYQILMFALCCV